MASLFASVHLCISSYLCCAWLWNLSSFMEMHFLLSSFIIYLKSLFAEAPVLSRIPQKAKHTNVTIKEEEKHTLLSTHTAHNVFFCRLFFQSGDDLRKHTQSVMRQVHIGDGKAVLPPTELMAAVSCAAVQCFISWLRLWKVRSSRPRRKRGLSARTPLQRPTQSAPQLLQLTRVVPPRFLELSPLLVSGAEELKTGKFRTFRLWCNAHTLCVFSSPAPAPSHCVCPASASSPWLSTVSVTYSLGTSLVSASAAHELWCAGSLLILLWMFLCPWEVHQWTDGALSDSTWLCPHWMTWCGWRASRSWTPPNGSRMHASRSCPWCRH